MSTDSINSTNKIFLTQTSDSLGDLSGKLTKTSVLNTIPPLSREEPEENWRNKYITEWRWRFLKFSEKQSIEISFIKKNDDENEGRNYINRYGEWIKRKVPSVYDEYVTKTYYYYSK